jgi:hypothetical protein
MIDKVKELLAEYKVSVGFVAGALVVGTAWGSCSFEPSVDVASTTTSTSTETVVTNQTPTEIQEAVNTNESTETVNANSNNDPANDNEENEETLTEVTQ